MATFFDVIKINNSNDSNLNNSSENEVISNDKNGKKIAFNKNEIDDNTNNIENNNNEYDNEQDEEMDSSYSNIIPVKKLQNGWSFVSSLIVNSAIAAKDKAVEINNSERVVQWKQSTTESLTKAQIVATPYYTSSKANILSVVEKTKENAKIVGEKIKPNIDKLGQDVKIVGQEVRRGSDYMVKGLASGFEGISKWADESSKSFKSNDNGGNSANTSTAFTV